MNRGKGASIERDFDLSKLQALKDRLESAGKKCVVVGVPASRNAPTDSGQSVAAVAATHEFGSQDGHIPERSFLRSSMHANMAKYVAINKVGLRAVARGETTVEQAMNRLGTVAATDVQVQLRTGVFTPLKPETIRRKGSDKPLIDTGQLRQSLTHEVRDA